MTTRLDLYLALERLVLAAENSDGKVADIIRDAMDPIWYALTREDHELLDKRTVGVITSIEGLRIPLGTHLHYVASQPAETRPIPSHPIEGWRKAA